MKNLLPTESVLLKLFFLLLYCMYFEDNIEEYLKQLDIEQRYWVSPHEK